MSGWLWWLIAAAAFGVGEMTLTTGFWLAPFALGAVAAAITEAAAGSEIASVAAFVVFSAFILVRLRPIVHSRLIASTPTLRTGGQALVGKRATVLERICNDESAGQVKIDGEIWSARNIDHDVVIEPGTTVQIIEIRGATALVME